MYLKCVSTFSQHVSSNTSLSVLFSQIIITLVAFVRGDVKYLEHTILEMKLKFCFCSTFPYRAFSYCERKKCAHTNANKLGPSHLKQINQIFLLDFNSPDVENP